MADQTDHLFTALADRYRLERRLGEGGMATVYLAEDLKHDRKVALKVLHPELAAVLGAQRFLMVRDHSWADMAGTPTLVVVQNFFGELRAKLKR